MTSVPKGTIGKTRKLRGLQKVDMTGQEFARFEAGKKAAKADISRRKQEAFFKETQKKLDNAPLARKGGAEMSKAEFARRTGGKTRADSMGAAIEMSRQPRGRTKAGDRRNEARLRKIQDDVRATDKAYDAAIKSGSIKKPTTSLARKAAGEPSNPAVQAAQRLQAKTAAKRAARRKAGREQRAKANLARTADTRNQPGSSMIRRPTQKMTRGNLRAERALEFYKDPKKALKAVNKTRRGFRMPRGLR